MLRELSTVLLEMQEALAPFDGGDDAVSRIRLRDATLELPMDLRVVFADGAPCLQADVARNPVDARWSGGMSRLRVRIQAMPWPDDDAEPAP